MSLLSLSCLTTHLIDHAGLRFTELCLPLSPSTRRGMYYHTQLIHIFCISSISVVPLLANTLNFKALRVFFAYNFGLIFSLFFKTVSWCLQWGFQWKSHAHVLCSGFNLSNGLDSIKASSATFSSHYREIKDK